MVSPNRILFYFFILIAFFAPLTATVFSKIVYFLNGMSIVIAIAVFLLKDKINFIKLEKLILSLFFIPILLSIAIGLPLFVATSPLFTNYSDISFFVYRLVNLSACFLYFLGVCSLVGECKGKSVYKKTINLFIKVYWIGTVLLVVSGIWQILSMYFGGINFPFDTRTMVHSVPNYLKKSVPGRVTGFASEPSYFVAIAIDSLILSFLFLRKMKLLIYFAISSIILFLSFSPSAVLDISFVVISFFFICLWSRNYRMTAIKIAITTIVIFILVLLTPIASKSKLIFLRFDTAFNPESHSRMFMILLPFKLIFQSNFLNMLFGHGPKSYSIIGESINLISGNPVHVTSNNFFADFIWECGLFGFLSSVVMFYSFIRKPFLIIKSMEGRISFFMACHLFASSIYRADYASLRFFIVMLIIIMLRSVASSADSRETLSTR